MKYWILESERDNKKIYLALFHNSFYWTEEVGFAHTEHTREDIVKLIEDVLKECKEKELAKIDDEIARLNNMKKSIEENI